MPEAPLALPAPGPIPYFGVGGGSGGFAGSGQVASPGALFDGRMTSAVP